MKYRWAIYSAVDKNQIGVFLLRHDTSCEPFRNWYYHNNEWVEYETYGFAKPLFILDGPDVAQMSDESKWLRDFTTTMTRARATLGGGE